MSISTSLYTCLNKFSHTMLLTTMTESSTEVSVRILNVIAYQKTIFNEKPAV